MLFWLSTTSYSSTMVGKKIGHNRKKRKLRYCLELRLRRVSNSNYPQVKECGHKNGKKSERKSGRRKVISQNDISYGILGRGERGDNKDKTCNSDGCTRDGGGERGKGVGEITMVMDHRQTNLDLRF